MATFKEIKERHEDDQLIISGHANVPWDECYLEAHQDRADLLTMVDMLLHMSGFTQSQLDEAIKGDIK